jgi:hypothetical protein
MAWTQLVDPRLDTTDTPGSCLRFLQTAFNTRAQHYSAFIAYGATQYKHFGRIMPNVAVPVWFTWYGTVNGDTRQWGHVAVWVPSVGKFLSSPLWWSAGKSSQWVDSLDDFTRILGASCKFLAWSEDLNGTQIVSGFSSAGASVTPISDGVEDMKVIFADPALGGDGSLALLGEYTFRPIGNMDQVAAYTKPFGEYVSVSAAEYLFLQGEVGDRRGNFPAVASAPVDMGALASAVASAIGNINVNVDALASAIAKKLGAPVSEPITKADIQAAIEANYKESK